MSPVVDYQSGEKNLNIKLNTVDVKERKSVCV